ncbi:putative membrane protein [Povalibacter uvarum]|uniref:Putative membrane protein n=1 Tax=Povalibacter uvarum TaxID=732238 RepID=A0A841HU42_9GAMM|nr:hypothetical protein [Povalibacter uvarum]MBB6095502.1 putative membrane protein [Povalibacter uvarum]
MTAAVDVGRRSPFFLYMALAFLAIALVGFSTTFFLPLARGTFEAPAVVHVHGALLFGWLILLITQVSLIRSRNPRTHRRMGWIGAALCAAIVVSGVLVGLFATRRDLAAGGGDVVIGGFVNILIEMIVFGTLVGAAIVFRRDPESHKRLLILATISALAPAWLRFRHFMPFVPNPFVTFSLVADSVLLIAVAHDWMAYRRVHPIYLWAGGAMVGVHAVELLAIESQPWVRLGRWLLGEQAV